MNNDGGGIFELLEQGRPEHAASLRAGLRYADRRRPGRRVRRVADAVRRVSTVEDLVAAVTDPRESLQVIEVRVPRPSSA